MTHWVWLFGIERTQKREIISSEASYVQKLLWNTVFKNMKVWNNKYVTYYPWYNVVLSMI